MGFAKGVLHAGGGLTSNGRIMDFEFGIDTIDFSNIVAGSFTFIDGADFSGTGAEINVTYYAGNTVLWMDVNGDGLADMKIFVADDITFTASDFIL